jgi:hypothetical protein
MGLHLESSDALVVIDAASLHFTKIRHLLPSPWAFRFESSATTYTVPTESLRVFSFQSEPLDAEVSCEVLAQGGLRGLKKSATIESEPRTTIVPKGSAIGRLVYCNCDPSGELIYAVSWHFGRTQTRHVFHDDDDVWLIQKIQRRSEKVNLRMWVRCPSTTIWKESSFPSLTR